MDNEINYFVSEDSRRDPFPNISPIQHIPPKMGMEEFVQRYIIHYPAPMSTPSKLIEEAIIIYKLITEAIYKENHAD